MAKKKKKTKKQKLWIFVRIQLVFLVLVVGAIAWYYFSGYAAKISAMREEAKYLVKNSTADTFRTSQTSIAYDVNGNTLSVLKGEKDVYYVESEEIPSEIKKAIISIEDKKFYDHHGVDYKAIVRAAWSMVRNRRITQGASTITQQLARNIFLTQEKTWERKVEEIFVASELEKKYSKDAILEFYLNNIYFGNGYYGIRAASMGYFSKELDELSISEIAFLCAIPNNPSYYDPLLHFDHTITRRNLVLDNMLADHAINENVYYTAVHTTIVLNQPEEVVEKHDYAETYTFYCATRALMEMNGFIFQTQFASDEAMEKYQQEYDEMYASCNASLYSGGYRIYTSLDLTTQAMLQESVDNALSEFTEVSEEGVYTLQGAAVCIDNNTGMVRAIVGGRSQDLAGYTLNRAFQSYRQPGSCIKPLIVYTPALERNYTPDTIVTDQPIEDGPENADGRYAGDITLRRAVELSKNTVAWQIFEEMTPQVGIAYLHEMDFQKITDADEIPAASLGGLTKGVSPLEMAKGYATIENDGAYRNPTCILKITDAMNNILYASDQTQAVVYEETASRQMTDILQGVLTESYATGYGRDLGDMPAAAKTGTTNDNKDGWFVGYTSYYTTSVWVGYDQPKTLPGLSGSNYPGEIWQDFMLKLHEGLTPREFLKPAEATDTYDVQPRVYVDETEDEEEPDEDAVTDVITDTLLPEENTEEVRQDENVDDGTADEGTTEENIGAQSTEDNYQP